ncbi:hypothetical protein [Fischerella sp. PCC 9605]|uniref:hypothetical protein n=1 Tax=Fischerella sp. PCC 9605 TaxID=1173024 RepID=UPI0012DD24E4|nr:hypothetical protein [Fischerella sp. PCC 9605]
MATMLPAIAPSSEPPGIIETSSVVDPITLEANSEAFVERVSDITLVGQVRSVSQLSNVQPTDWVESRDPCKNGNRG